VIRSKGKRTLHECIRMPLGNGKDYKRRKNCNCPCDNARERMRNLFVTFASANGKH